jgi:hypothetical protein
MTPRSAGEGASAAPVPVRPAAYGRNYSYFSHRIFVAFMPEDLHQYLYNLMELSTTAAGSTDAEAEIDMHLVRWVLLHRSQLNALSLNRQIEAWRGPEDVLLIPPKGALRRDQYQMDITLQFALELALAEAVQSPLLQNRPWLYMVLLDAAYYVSRKRADQDRGGTAAAKALVEADIDLSQQGRAAFASYLVQRMNLNEDHVQPLPKTGDESQQPLSNEEINWLYGVAITVARTLSSSASNVTDLRQRWESRLADRWLELQIPVPDQTLYDVLLTGPDSPLIELPLETPEYGTVTSGARPSSAHTESFRFKWRVPPFPEAPWARSLRDIAEKWSPVCDFVDAVDTMLRHAMDGADATFPRTDADAPLHLLSDLYRVLPAAPAWTAVSFARENMRQAAKGVGNVDSLLKDARELEKYATMLRTFEAAEAVALALVLGAALAGWRLGEPRAEAFPIKRKPPTTSDWSVGLGILSDGLQLNDCDLLTAAARLRLIHQEMFPFLPVPLPIPRQPQPPIPQQGGLEDASLLAAGWPTPEMLDEAVLSAFGDARLSVGLNSGALKAKAWESLQERLRLLARGAAQSPPASAAELLCEASREGPGALLPLRPEYAGYRVWTQLLLQTLDRAPIDNGNRDLAPQPPPVTLVAHALERLGVRALRIDLQDALVNGLPQTDASELHAYIEQHALWAGRRDSERIALVLGPTGTSMVDAWPLPPQGGLVFAAVDAELRRVLTLVLNRLPESLKEPVRVAIEPGSSHAGTGISFGQYVDPVRVARFVCVWLYREGAASARPVHLIEPRSADDLWLVAQERPATGSAAS